MRFTLGGVEFGGPDGPLIVTGFDPGAPEVRSNDQPNTGRDGSTAGPDTLGAAVWAFDISTNRDDLTGARETAAALAAAWRDPEVRAGTALVPLSYEVDGQWRRVYGKPDKYAGPAADLLATLGVGRIVCDFRVLDPLFYEEQENSVTLTIVPATTGGLESPLMAPLSTVRSSAPRAGLVTNGGEAATPLKATFHGPVTDPWVRTAAGLEIALRGSLASDQSVTIDPLAGTVTRQDGAPAAGMLTRKTRLTSSLLPAGSTEITFGGTDPTGTARAVLSWRDAHTEI